MSGIDYYVIFGAAVRPGGMPSNTLRRRIEGAFLNAEHDPNALFLASGVIGLHGPSEARAIAQCLMAMGVDPERIIEDHDSEDTLQSVVKCLQIIRKRKDANRIVICTSAYHIPRCRILFRIFGARTEAASMLSDIQIHGLPKWLKYAAREGAALIYDVMAAIAQRLRGNGEKVSRSSG